MGIEKKAIKDKRLNTDEQFKRMRENFDDKSIIDLNNRVAYENNLSPKGKGLFNTNNQS